MKSLPIALIENLPQKIARLVPAHCPRTKHRRRWDGKYFWKFTTN